MGHLPTKRCCRADPCYFVFHADNVSSYHSIRTGARHICLCHVILAIVAFQHTNNKYLHGQQVVWWQASTSSSQSRLERKKKWRNHRPSLPWSAENALEVLYMVSQVGALSYCIVFLVFNKSKRGANPWCHHRVCFPIQEQFRFLDVTLSHNDWKS